METADKIVGENIKNMRETRGVSQAQLADAIGISVKSLSLIENGHTQIRRANLIAIADFFQVKPEALHKGGEALKIETSFFSKETAAELLKMLEDRDAQIAKLKHDIENLQRDANSTYGRDADAEKVLDAYIKAPIPMKRYAWFYLTGVWAGATPIELARRKRAEADRAYALRLLKSAKEET